MPDLSMTEETYTPDSLLAGSTMPRVTETVVIASGQNIKRGTLLGKITTDGKYTISLSASSDGSQTPVAIATEDVNATLADRKSAVFLTGEFNPAAMTFGTGHSATTATTTDALKGRGIYLKSIVGA